MKAKRVVSYDLFRGVLVIAMIFYHVFVNLYNNNLNHYLSLARVSIGFVRITGIITGEFLLNKQKKQWSIIGKLLMFYLTINIAIWLYQNHTRQTIGSTLLLWSQEKTSFEILLPISLTIAIGGIIGNYSKKSGERTLYAATILSSILLLLDQQGIYIFSLNFTLYGLLWVVMGSYYQREKISNQVLSNRWREWIIIALTATLTWYLTITPHTNIVIPLLHTYLIYRTIHIIAKHSQSKHILTILTKIWKLSLAIYIIHIIIIKIINHFIETTQRTTSLLTATLLIGLSIRYTNATIQNFMDKFSTVWKKLIRHLFA